MKTINARGRLISTAKVLVMGICNITIDSFYKHSRVLSEHQMIELVMRHLKEGADIIDLGAMSSRPGSHYIPESVELESLLWAIEIIEREFPNVILSIDTFRSNIVEKLSEKNIHMINDISGGNNDEKMLDMVAKHRFPYVMMHMQGDPSTMQDNPQYPEGVLMELLNFFKKRVVRAQGLGIQDIIIDPGFGFGKTIDQNYELLNNLGSFELFDLPILVGLSRKSMIFKVLGNNPENALNGTTSLHMIAIQNGANILRVHDVKEAKECITLYEKCQANL